MEYTAERKKELLPFMTACVDLISFPITLSLFTLFQAHKPLAAP